MHDGIMPMDWYFTISVKMQMIFKRMLIDMNTLIQYVNSSYARIYIYIYILRQFYYALIDKNKSTICCSFNGMYHKR